MVYLLVFIALFCLTLKGYCGKKTSTYVKNTGDSFLFNLARMIFCVIIGLALVFIEGVHGSLNVDYRMLAICLLSGVSNAAFLAGWLLAIQKNAMVVVDVALTIGSIIPAILCTILFDEPISWQKMIGFSLIILATLILSGYNKNVKRGAGFIGALLLIIATVGDGLTGFGQQLYKQYFVDGGDRFVGVSYENSVYQFYTFLFAATILLILFAIYSVYAYKKGIFEKEKGYAKYIWLSLKNPMSHIFVMAICLFAASYFQTLATSKYAMPSQVLYPIIKGGCLITVNFTAMLFFGEKPTRRSIIGSLTALGGIIAMNFL